MSNLPIKPNNLCDNALFVTICAVIVLLPIFHLEELRDYVKTGNFIIFLILLAVGTSVLFLRAVFENQIDFHLKKVDAWMLSISAYLALNHYLGSYAKSLSINTEELLCLGVFYFFLRALPDIYKSGLLTSVMVSGLIQGFLGLLQYFALFHSNHKLFSVTGSFANPGPFGGYIAIVACLAANLLIYRLRFRNIAATLSQRKKTFFLLIGTLIITVPVIVLSESRSAVFAFLASLIFTGIFYIAFRSKKIKKNWYLRPFSLVMASTLFLIMAGIILYRININSGNGRILIWKISLKIIGKNPLFGVGFDNFRSQYMNFQENYFRNNGTMSEKMVASNITSAFNEVLQFIAENGFVGLSLLSLFVLIIPWRKITDRQKALMISYLSGIVAVIVFSLFSYPGEILPIKIIIIVMLSLIAGIGRKESVYKVKVKNTFMAKSVISLIAVSFLYISTTRAWLYYSNFEKWKIAISDYRIRSYSESLEGFEKVYPFFNSDGLFLTSYGKILSISGQHDKAIDILQDASHYLNSNLVQTTIGDSYKAKRLYQKAEQAYLKASYMVPSQFYAKYLLAKLYQEWGKKTEAALIANEIISMPIKISSPAVREMRLEMSEYLKNK